MKRFKQTELPDRKSLNLSEPAGTTGSVPCSSSSEASTPKIRNERRSALQELVLALSKSKEVSSIQSLSEFLRSVGAEPKYEGGQSKVVDNYFVCTLRDYSFEKFEAIKRQSKTFAFEDRFDLIMFQVGKQLLEEGNFSHLLTQGFMSHEQDSGERKISKCKTNLSHFHFDKPAFKSIYLALGDSLYFHLFKDYLIFCQSNQETLVQVSGRNIYSSVCEMELDRLNTSSQITNKLRSALGGPSVDRRSLKFNLNSELSQAEKVPAFSDRILRQRIFYFTHQNRGNRFFRNSLFNDNSLTLDEKVVKVIKSHFGPMRLRQSLKYNLEAILSEVIRKLPNLNFSRLLSEHAPLPFNWAGRKEELLQMAKDPAERPLVYYELFEKSSSSPEEVTAFLWAITREAFPPKFLAGRTNRNSKILFRKIKEFVAQNRFETFDRTTLMAKFEPNNFQWSQFSASHAHAKFFMRENEFVAWRLLKWVFEEVYALLVRCFFYATEKSKQGSKVFYYRKNVWNLVLKLSIADLLKENVRSVAKTEMVENCRRFQLAPAKLRIVPKVDSFRPIMTFNRKLSGHDNKTMNRKLNNAHLMLKQLKAQMQRTGYGCPVFNLNDIMARYREFVMKWKAKGRPPLYFVAMDIEKCYDSVDVRDLQNFLWGTKLIEKKMRICSCLVLKRGSSSLSGPNEEAFLTHFKPTFEKLGLGMNTEYKHLNQVIDQEQLSLKRAIVLEEESRKTIYKNEQLKLISAVVGNNYITLNKKQYSQIKGIPQGLCISNILASFFFATVEKRDLSFLNNQDRSINCMMRLTDDYLLITDKKDDACKFIQNMFKVSKTNRFKFNLKKMRTNFRINPALLKYDHQDPTPNIQFCEESFHYLVGTKIDTRTLEITLRPPSLQKQAILATLNINLRTKQSAQWLKRKLKSFLMNNVTYYFDKELTSPGKAQETLRLLCTHAAIKFVPCARQFKAHRQLPGTDRTLADIIYLAIRSLFHHLCSEGSILEEKDFNAFFIACLKHFQDVLQLSKGSLGSGLYKLIRVKIVSFSSRTF